MRERDALGLPGGEGAYSTEDGPPKMVKKILLLTATVCLTLLLGELGFRYRYRAWPFARALYIPEYLTASDATLRWRPSPTEGRNSLGLRNRELGPKKLGTKRILFLGDSLIWGGETSSGELYTEVLERRLNARLPNGSDSFEVINAGIPGYTTYQELEFLKIYGVGLKPDLVVLGFVINDLFHPYLQKPTEGRLLDRDPNSLLYRFNPFAGPGKLFGRSYLAHEVANASGVVLKKVRGRPVFRFDRRGDFYLAWKDYAWPQARTLIGEMQALLAERMTPLTVLVFPVSDQVNDQYRRLDLEYVLYPQARIREICAAYRIPTLDLTDLIHKHGGTKLFRDYLHLNGEGNDVVARSLESYLARMFGLDEDRAVSPTNPPLLRESARGAVPQ